MIEVTRAHAEKIVELLGHGLSSGLGTPEPGKMCVEALVCYALGLPHGDDPDCVSPALRSLKISLNDKPWSSPQARANGLRRLAVAQLGSAGALNDREFARRVAEMTIRVMVPLAMRAAATRVTSHAEAFEVAAVRCETEGTWEAAQAIEQTAPAYAYAASAAATAAYAATAATATVVYASPASATAAYPASATAYAYPASAAASYAADAADYAARAADDIDRVLSDFAECVVQILIEMNAPGCQFLDLVPVEARQSGEPT
jgi:hypothetical protein